MIQLRAWQVECVKKALLAYESQSHFLCHATPGAGKTVMVASVAKALFQRDKIDFVVCFSPSRAVADGVAGTFRQILGRSFNGQIGAAGGRIPTNPWTPCLTSCGRYCANTES